MNEYLFFGILGAFFAAIFVAWKQAYLLSNKLLVEVERRAHPLFDKMSDSLIDKEHRAELTVRLGRMASMVFYILLFARWSSAGDPWRLLVLAVVVLAVELLPLAAVRISPHIMLRFLAPLIYIFYWIFYPFIWVRSSSLTPIDMAVEEQDDLQALLQQSIENPDPDNDQQEITLLNNALEFAQKKVRQCMIPRVDMTVFDFCGSVEDLLKLFIETQYSRIPVFEGSVDRIVGYVASRRLFEKPSSVSEVMTPVIYVPVGASVRGLLADLIKSRSSLAVVLDEYGTTAGMITLEDLLEEIFGEIDDEHDLENKK